MLRHQIDMETLCVSGLGMLILFCFDIWFMSEHTYTYCWYQLVLEETNTTRTLTIIPICCVKVRSDIIWIL